MNHESFDSRFRIADSVPLSCAPDPLHTVAFSITIAFISDVSSRPWRNLPSAWVIHMATRRPAHKMPIQVDLVLFQRKPYKKSMWIGVLWAGLWVAMWIAHVGGKFSHGLLETSLNSILKIRKWFYYSGTLFSVFWGGGQTDYKASDSKCGLTVTGAGGKRDFCRFSLEAQAYGGHRKMPKNRGSLQKTAASKMIADRHFF